MRGSHDLFVFCSWPFISFSIDRRFLTLPLFSYVKLLSLMLYLDILCEVRVGGD